MNASYEPEPFSPPEWVAGGIAVTAVALVAFLAFQRIPQSLPLRLSAIPLTAAQRPETAPAGPSAKAGQRRRHAPVSTAQAPPGESPAAAARPSVLGPERLAETSAPAFPPAAVPAKQPAPAMSGVPNPSIGLLELFRMRNAIVSPSLAPTAAIATPAARDATRNPSSLSDALRIQAALRELGYFSGNVNGTWGPASRRALRDFKAMNGFPDNDEWDRETEQALSSGHSVRAPGAFTGAWAQSIEACQAGGGAPLVIRPRGASIDGGRCDFRSVRRETAASWRIEADCSAEKRIWHANISLKLTASTLNWASERGADTYVRCPRP
jgi:hypothetical protein